MGILERIKEIEQEMDKTQKNKATEGHLGMLKARLAKLRSELLTPSSGGGGGQVIRCATRFCACLSEWCCVLDGGWPEVGGVGVYAIVREEELSDRQQRLHASTTIGGGVAKTSDVKSGIVCSA